ncbi:hypothetical protein BY458DRAFT_438704 [Sporodiniella umbellata]|nr:hypothetical protein BY458DRAFT_438704 [Sporodiniella umbellata]
MSLVHYSSDSEEEEHVPQKRTLSSLLPEPKKVVYVDLPKIEKEEEEEEQDRKKRPKTSAGFSLADLLPAPKNTNPFERTEGQQISIAQKVREKKKEPAPEPILEPEEKEEEKLEDTQKTEEDEPPKKHVGSFFHLGKDLKQEPTISAKPKTIQPVTTGLVHTVERPKEGISQPIIDDDYDPNAMYSTDPSAYQYYQQYQQTEQVEEENTDDLQHLVGHRMRGECNIQFTTVNQSDMLPTEEERATQLLTQAPVFDEGPGLTASKLQLKNNNIMALAAHAVNNREKLDSMFSEQKKTRRDAAKKYGKYFISYGYISYNMHLCIRFLKSIKPVKAIFVAFCH